jgi:DNA-binding MarR family transcriptional regulator
MQLQLDGRLARQLAEDSQMSYADYVVLVALTDAPEGRLRLFELAQRLAWEKSRVSHQITRMAERGLVAKHRCSSDRRGAFVEVTAGGRAEIAAAAPGHVAAVRRLFLDHLTAEQLDEVAEVAETVLARLQGCADDA